MYLNNMIHLLLFIMFFFNYSRYWFDLQYSSLTYSVTMLCVVKVSWIWMMLYKCVLHKCLLLKLYDAPTAFKYRATVWMMNVFVFVLVIWYHFCVIFQIQFLILLLSWLIFVTYKLWFYACFKKITDIILYFITYCINWRDLK